MNNKTIIVKLKKIKKRNFPRMKKVTYKWAFLYSQKELETWKNLIKKEGNKEWLPEINVKNEFTTYTILELLEKVNVSELKGMTIIQFATLMHYTSNSVMGLND
jgi:hypothetical protein